MTRAEPFVVHETQCPVEGTRERAAGAVRWRTLLSADRTPTAALTLGVVELEPGDGTAPRLHRHAQPETYYVLEGEGRVRIGDREEALRPGHTVFIPGGALHAAWNTGTSVLRILYAFPTDSFAEVEYEFPEPEGAGR